MIRQRWYEQLLLQPIGKVFSKIFSKLISKIFSKLISKIFSKLISKIFSKLISKIFSKLISKIFSKIFKQPSEQLHKTFLSSSLWFSNRLKMTVLSSWRCMQRSPSLSN
jgi:cellobiose-specific phosphotransferase system component IIC